MHLHNCYLQYILRQSPGRCKAAEWHWLRSSLLSGVLSVESIQHFVICFGFDARQELDKGVESSRNRSLLGG